MYGNYDLSFGSEIVFGEEPSGDNNESMTTTTNIVDNKEDEGTRQTINTNAGGTSNIYGTSSSGYKYNNRYYYKSLNSYGKAIYDALESNIDNLKTGTYRVNINYDFNSLLSSQNGQSELRSSYNDAVNALNLDVPDLFYIDFEKMFLTISETKTIFSTKYDLYIDQEKNANYLANDFSSKADVDFAVSQIDRIKNQAKARGSSGTDSAKLRGVHDFLIDYMYYNSESNQKATVYGAFVEAKGVCEAYSRAYKSILDDIGIENILVTGTAVNSTGATEEHMWNYVKVNGNWYAVDVTWDDPIVIGGGTLSEETKHKYFLVRKRGVFQESYRKAFDFSKPVDCLHHQRFQLVIMNNNICIRIANLVNNTRNDKF